MKQTPYLKQPLTLKVIGAPFSFGQKLVGVDSAPKRLRDAGLLQKIQGLGWRAEDMGDLRWPAPLPVDLKDLDEKSGMLQLLAERTERAARAGSFCLNLGGDHSIAFGSITGLMKAYPDLIVFWIDAHGDMNTPKTSPSGNLHGMPLAGLLGQIDYRSELPGFQGLANNLDPSRLVLIGVRDLDPGELDLIARLKIKNFSMEEISRKGIEQVMHEALHAVDPFGNSPIHLSFDIDALDPAFAPSTGVHASGGMTLDEAKFAASTLSETGRLVGMDLTEINPQLGQSEESDQTLQAGLDVILTALGDEAEELSIDTA